jgi:hypothetical protein
VAHSPGRARGHQRPRRFDGQRPIGDEPRDDRRRWLSKSISSEQSRPPPTLRGSRAKATLPRSTSRPTPAWRTSRNCVAHVLHPGGGEEWRLRIERELTPVLRTRADPTMTECDSHMPPFTQIQPRWRSLPPLISLPLPGQNQPRGPGTDARATAKAGFDPTRESRPVRQIRGARVMLASGAIAMAAFATAELAAHERIADAIASFEAAPEMKAIRQEGAIRHECRSLRALEPWRPRFAAEKPRSGMKSSPARKARSEPQSAIRASPSAGRGHGRARVRRSALARRGSGVCGWL